MPGQGVDRTRWAILDSLKGQHINSDGKKFLDNEPIWIFPNLKHNFIWKNEKMEISKDDDIK